MIGQDKELIERRVDSNLLSKTCIDSGVDDSTLALLECVPIVSNWYTDVEANVMLTDVMLYGYNGAIPDEAIRNPNSLTNISLGGSINYTIFNRISVGGLARFSFVYNIRPKNKYYNTLQLGGRLVFFLINNNYVAYIYGEASYLISVVDLIWRWL